MAEHFRLLCELKARQSGGAEITRPLLLMAVILQSTKQAFPRALVLGGYVVTMV